MNRLLLAVFMLGGIQPWIMASETKEIPPPHYLEAAGQGIPVYKVDAKASQVAILVFKGGKLAQFGHDHVISTTDIEGWIVIPADSAGSSANLLVPLDTLEVDRQELRDKYGIDKNVSAFAKKSTRKNMFDKVLEIADWPSVAIEAKTTDKDSVLAITLTLHGIEKTFELPVQLQNTEDELRVQGIFELLQTDYGVKPFTAMAGELRVRNRVEIHFDLWAKRHYFEERSMENTTGK